MVDFLHALRLGAERSGLQERELAADLLKEAGKSLDAAKAQIEKLTDALRCFIDISESQRMRDFAEVKRNLANARALVISSPEVLAGISAIAATLASKGQQRRPSAAEDEKSPQTPTPAPPAEIQAEAPPALLPEKPASHEANEQRIVNAVFSEIEAILRKSN